MMKKTYFYLILISCTSLFFSGCKDPYPYNDKEPGPDVLGASIYDYLEKAGNYKYYLSLVNSVQDAGTNYAEVLSKTGTKTVFVADDSAFEAFFKNNPYGIQKFEDFTDQQKRAILFSGMLDDTYLMEMLANMPGVPPNKGQALRRYTSWQVLDNVKYESADQMPGSSYWNSFREKGGIYVLNDNSRWTMVHFLDAQMRANDITPDDFNYLTRTPENPAGDVWNMDDAYIFNVKVVKKDITCKNGYINVLEKLQLPPDNMAELIRKNTDSKLFNHFLERFCAPYYDAANTQNYRLIHSDFLDKLLYAKHFFTADNQYLPSADGLTISNNKAPALLKFDPSDNSANLNNLTTSTTAAGVGSDMGVMFVPTDDALNKWFNEGSGAILKERYGTWDSVPDNVMNVLINNHMWSSFLQSTPSRFDKIANNMGTSLNVKKEDVIYTNICSNGVVYHVNRVYTPSDYASVLAPVVLGQATKMMYWCVLNLQFNLYLSSLENKFSFIVPTDDVFDNYIYPVSVGWGKPERWKFYFARLNVPAVVRYDAVTGDSIGVVNNTTIINNLLTDIVNNHIVVGDIEDGKTFYQTKGGATIKVMGTGVGMALDGKGNSAPEDMANVVRVYNQENGKTFLTDKLVLTPTQSVYSILQSDDRFSKFFELCLAVRPVMSGTKNIGGGSVFVNGSFVGITENVSFFNTYNYTVYVPTNEAMDQAYGAGRYRMPDDIMNDSSLSTEEKGAQMQQVYEFLRYHFQDNSVYIGGTSYSDNWFETATLNPSTDKFRRVYVTNNSSSLSVRGENGNTANVITSGGLYNLMARDYLFNTKLITTAQTIETSSFAVVHQIDAVLDFQTK